MEPGHDFCKHLGRISSVLDTSQCSLGEQDMTHSDPTDDHKC